MLNKYIYEFADFPEFGTKSEIRDKWEAPRW